MKAQFIERLGAYIIDIFLVSMIASLICYSLPKNNSNVEEILSTINEKYTSGEMTSKEFYSEYNKLLYQNQKDTVIPTCVSLVLTIGYFVVFQYMNKGQTLGKKIFKLRVVDKENNQAPTVGKGLVRSLIPLGILSSTINLITINLTKQSIYIPCYYIVSSIEIIFIFASIILILTKDGAGLHDIIVGTKVIKEGR